MRQPSEHFILIIAFPLPLRLGYTRARCYTGCCEDGLPSNEFCARLEGHPSSLPVRSALCVWTRRSPDLLGVISASASPSFSPGPYPTFLQSLSEMGCKLHNCVPETENTFPQCLKYWKSLVFFRRRKKKKLKQLHHLITPKIYTTCPSQPWVHEPWIALE